MIDPVKWDRAKLAWTSNGYVLEAPLRVDDRVVHEAAKQLEPTVAEILDSFGFIAVRACGWDARADALGIESPPSKLEIIIREVPSPEAMARLRDAVSTLMRNAVERSRQANEAEEPLVQGALAALRDG
jgi:hypothetical protein